MSMTKLIEDVQKLVDEEYIRASREFGCTNNSDHESYAVLLEEFDEGKDEVNTVDQRVQLFWESVKHNLPDEHKFSTLKGIGRAALLAACEFIQVAAVARKAALTVSNRNVFLDLTGEEGETE